MPNKNRIRILLSLLSGFLATGNVLAVSVTGDPIYEKVDKFTHSVSFTDGFIIEAKGVYQATLTDYKDRAALKSSGMHVTNTRTDSLGELSGPGVFTFEAEQGKHFVSLFAEASDSQVTAEEKQRLIDEVRIQLGKIRWHKLTEDQKQAEKELWKKRSAEERLEHEEKIRNKIEKRLAERLASLNTGKYGIDIKKLEGAEISAIPLPAAVWLFGSGILALAGLGHRKVKQ